MDRDEINSLQKYREDLQNIITASEKIIEDRLFALATGGLLASLTLFQIKPITCGCAKSFLCISWVLLGGAVISILLSLVFAKKEIGKYILDVEERIKGNEKIVLEEIQANTKSRIERTNTLSLILTILGIVVFIISAAITLLS